MKSQQHTTPGKGLRAVAAAVLLPAGLPAPAAQTGLGSRWVGGEEEEERQGPRDRSMARAGRTIGSGGALARGWPVMCRRFICSRDSGSSGSDPHSCRDEQTTNNPPIDIVDVALVTAAARRRARHRRGHRVHRRAHFEWPGVSCPVLYTPAQGSSQPTVTHWPGHRTSDTPAKGHHRVSRV